MNQKLNNKVSKFRFEFKHITVLLVILVSFQIILSFIQKSSLQNFLDKTQKWYQQDSAERIANLSTTSLELLVGNIKNQVSNSEKDKQKIVQSFNIIFSQQLLEPNIDETCLIILKNNIPIVINEGIDIFDFLTDSTFVLGRNTEHEQALKLFLENENYLRSTEEIFTKSDISHSFHILVPFIPFGEFVGVFYMKYKPNFEFITQEILTSYNEVALIYTSLILLGLLAMYYISSFTVKERNEATQLFYEEQEKHLKDTIVHEKESMFTKRIYHTHHKAEKVMGFIKEDLRELKSNNMEETKSRVIKYSNFVSRVIYDMKWYDPPIQTIRNQAFNTNINTAIKFIVDNIFLRLSNETDIFKFELNFDDELPNVHINEFVVWEIIEPLLQNSIDHADVNKIKIKIETIYNPQSKTSQIIISDNGIGIAKELLEQDENSIKKIFSESVSSKSLAQGNRGYGCYIAYQIATVRCGWKLDVENLDQGGCRFIIQY